MTADATWQIDDLEAPYARYCENFFSDFDSWPTVQRNGKLAGLLEEISRPPADGSAPIFSDKRRVQEDGWTLDGLFALPQIRLKYYKKLYARLLKSTQPGRSDHRLLVAANDKLDDLLEKSKKRVAVSILDDPNLGAVPPQPPTPERKTSSIPPVASGRDSGPGSQLSLPLRAVSPLNMEPVSAALMGLEGALQLQTQLDTSRTLDIFTMTPKACQLQINRPDLPFKRELRCSADVVLYLTPRATGKEMVVRRAHIFLLTDLFLVCERMTPSEKAARPGPLEFWLLFPPLAGKHLKVTDEGGAGECESSDQVEPVADYMPRR